MATMLRVARVRLSSGGYRVALIASAVALMLVATLDLRRFFELFVLRSIPDLATPWFTAAR
ncbi:MAG TPA: hypothetical protein VMJ70_01580 [Candidatus Sulfotelmatobacter sp.]|nr:hypothetical protein [Candidatus Sulfotelmatobacter sp.]